MNQYKKKIFFLKKEELLVESLSTIARQNLPKHTSDASEQKCSCN